MTLVGTVFNAITVLPDQYDVRFGEPPRGLHARRGAGLLLSQFGCVGHDGPMN